MDVDPHKAWELFTSDPPDFLVMFVIVIVLVGGFVWWLRGHLTKVRIGMLNERKDKYGETRCYIRDPDGYIIEVGQSKPDFAYG